MSCFPSGVTGEVQKVVHEMGFPAEIVLRLDDGHWARVDVSNVALGQVH